MYFECVNMASAGEGTRVFDISFGGAALAGLLSFLSPCILPIVPFYLSYLAGMSADDLAAARESRGASRQAILPAIAFSLGILTIFMALGMAASTFGSAVREAMPVLRWIAAAIILAMGLHFLGVVKIPILYRQLRADNQMQRGGGILGAYVIGLAFAFGWTPCVGPVLAAILFQAADAGTATRGAMLLMVYGLGMTLPFIVAAAFVGPFMRWMQRFRRHMGKVEKGMGVLLIVFAILIGTDSINVIAQWMIDYGPNFTGLG